VCVKDHGIGIPPEHKKSIFERFHQADNAHRNSGLNLGLGLYISKEIIEKAGGEIWFESQVGKGSSFYFSLPCCR
jgi:signal transduction histidine kinase